MDSASSIIAMLSAAITGLSGAIVVLWRAYVRKEAERTRDWIRLVDEYRALLRETIATLGKREEA